jgi:penicillin-binding protein 1A
MILRFIGYVFGIGTAFAFLAMGAAYYYVGELRAQLPEYEQLAQYEPPVTTRIHASDGSLMAEYARERRLYLPVQSMPNLLKHAFISAEDKNFYRHGGIDYLALGKAAYDYGSAKMSGRSARARGASTITQQVAKNFLLTSDRTADRKIKEAMLALRIEETYSKEKILELYLNKIFLGLGAHGVAAASLAYFDKNVDELGLHDVAYLAALPKAPNNYHPYDDTEEALERRNWVIGRMVINGYVTAEEGEEAKAKPLGVVPRKAGSYAQNSEYFSEEVRREILDRYGEVKLYEGGLSVRTTLDPRLQNLAQAALKKGLIAYDRKRGYHGAHAQIDITGDWGEALADIRQLDDVGGWNQAVVLEVEGEGETARIGLRPDLADSGDLSLEREEVTISFADAPWAARRTFTTEGRRRSAEAKSFADIFEPGNVIHVSAKDEGDGYVLEQVPEVSGALVAMDPHTGRVLAMTGGFSFDQSQFNRATQARRQPGSSFKPFVYAAALDNGYTPSSVVLDEPFSQEQGGRLGTWAPKNYGGDFSGPSTLRLGIEKSRNLMTVRLANDMGMPLISEYSRRFGIYDRELVGLAASLGSRETTVMRMVGAYSVLANGGQRIDPSLIDRIQDRYGRTIYKHEQRVCGTCDASEWNNQEEPVLIDERELVLDPMTAYQITSMMEGVVLRGTATSVSKLGVPIAGKTGTTNDEKDAWFVGYAPDLVVGVFVGYDRPESMGRGATGGGLAAPIFTDFMKDALTETMAKNFRVPPGLLLYPIDRQTGLVADAGQPGVILEAFKPGTSPPDDLWFIGFEDEVLGGQLRAASEEKRERLEGAGGLF